MKKGLLFPRVSRRARLVADGAHEQVLPGMPGKEALFCFERSYAPAFFSRGTVPDGRSKFVGPPWLPGRDLTMVAQGEGQASNVTVTGSDLPAGNHVTIKANGDIVLRAAQNCRPYSIHPRCPLLRAPCQPATASKPGPNASSAMA
ncbi:hemagglutinin repeat-containing protein [Achromobacter xylosoxidans]